MGNAKNLTPKQVIDMKLTEMSVINSALGALGDILELSSAQAKVNACDLGKLVNLIQSDFDDCIEIIDDTLLKVNDQLEG